MHEKKRKSTSKIGSSFDLFRAFKLRNNFVESLYVTLIHSQTYTLDDSVNYALVSSVALLKHFFTRVLAYGI